MIASEKRIKGELEEAQQRLKYLEDKDRRDSRRLSDDDAVRKIRALEEAVLQLQKKLGEKKQVIIGTAFMSWWKKRRVVIALGKPFL